MIISECHTAVLHIFHRYTVIEDILYTEYIINFLLALFGRAQGDELAATVMVGCRFRRKVLLLIG